MVVYGKKQVVEDRYDVKNHDDDDDGTDIVRDKADSSNRMNESFDSSAP